MANKIYIQFLADDDFNENIIETPLMDDPQIEAKSTFSSYGDMIPGDAKDLAEKFVGAGAASSGSVGEGILNALNKIDLRRWQKTEPLKITVKLSFKSETDSKKDVFDPIVKLLSYSILTKKTSEAGVVKYITPGINIDTMAEIANGKTEGLSSKLIAIEIPGFVYIPQAIIENSVPVLSKNKTQSGFPLWGTIELTISSVFPANTEFFESIENQFGFQLNELTSKEF